MLYGTEVHKACEDYVGEGKPLAKNYERFKPVLDVFINMEGTKYPEYIICCNQNDCNENVAKDHTGYKPINWIV